MRKRILLISISAVIVLMLAGVFAIDKIFSLIFVQNFSMSTFESESYTKSPGTAEAEKKEEHDRSVALDKEKEQSPQNNVGVANSTDAAEETVNKEEVPEIKKENGNTNKGTGLKESYKTESKSPSVIVDEKKINEIEKKVSLGDKTKALSIVVGSVTRDDISRLYQLAKSGVTEAEKQEAMAILRQRLTPEKKNELKALYEKYEHLLK
ncbi:MAG: hypothetical protein JG777_3131 [Clostridia bacterium]|jgi:hypothetical protein|uniref:hypothetical protein n=1 Tax=Petroclostridium xylanilyticum TaxID=1792311 RepID=UPI000B985D24|nr:hypothetical protein [Petroclostridium xylanilyticum]MBZ4647642.1 hypothetical protein [Clostridia bacterium]